MERSSSAERLAQLESKPALTRHAEDVGRRKGSSLGALPPGRDEAREVCRGDTPDEVDKLFRGRRVIVAGQLGVYRAPGLLRVLEEAGGDGLAQGAERFAVLDLGELPVRQRL